MKSTTLISEVRSQVAEWRRAQERVAFVPTMGNLHDGHLALVAQARAVAPRVVVSIFVNPLQFGPAEDLGAYPRTPAEDAARLRAAGVDLLFSPAEEEIYPWGREGVTCVEVPGLSDILCGASRPGHFVGVATVVAKLFNIVQPDVALFGQKDYQQLAVLRRMVRDLCFPLEVVGVPTVREADGLAMSSRNGYLSPEERQKAPALYRALGEIAARLQAGEGDLPKLESLGAEALRSQGLRPDYFAIRRAGDLGDPGPGEPLVVLAAAYLGKARLIDNLVVEI